jgi:hypothetical protein
MTEKIEGFNLVSFLGSEIGHLRDVAAQLLKAPRLYPEGTHTNVESE